MKGIIMLKLVGIFFGIQVIDGFSLTAEIAIAGFRGWIHLSPSGQEEADTLVQAYIIGANAPLFTTFQITSLPPIFGQMEPANEVCDGLRNGDVLVPSTQNVTLGSTQTISEVAAMDFSGFNREAMAAFDFDDNVLAAAAAADIGGVGVGPVGDTFDGESSGLGLISAVGDRQCSGPNIDEKKYFLFVHNDLFHGSIAVVSCKLSEDLVSCSLHSCTAEMLECSGELAKNENGCELCECEDGEGDEDHGEHDDHGNVVSGENQVAWSYTIPSFTTKEAFNRGILITTSPGATELDVINLCAVLLPTDEEVVTHRATFLGPVYGRVWIRASKSTQGLFIYSDLSFAEAGEGKEEAGTTSYTLTSYNAGKITHFHDVYDIYLNPCASLDAELEIAEIQVGNSATATTAKMSLRAPSICESSVGKFIAIKDSFGSRVACTELEMVTSKTVTARIDWDNVQGFVSMSQNSPFDATITTVQLAGETMLPAAYGINNFPVPPPLPQSGYERCNEGNVGGPFNPYDVTSLLEAKTTDQFAVGGLSEKYGGIADKQGINITTRDWNLPLFGINSVVGRSIVVINSEGYRVCGTIQFTQDVVTAVATFKQPIYGSIYFRQAVGNSGDDVIIFGELANLDSSTTSENIIDVNENQVETSCDLTGGQFDPSGVSDTTGYGDICSSSNYFFCRLGDIHGKHGGISILSQLHGSNEFFFSSAYLPLAGPLSIIGRSVVVSAQDQKTPFACANILTVHTTRASNNISHWYGDNTGGTVTGTVTFEQTTAYDRTDVNIAVLGLDGKATNYSIHTTPVNDDDRIVEQCSALFVGTLFDPFETKLILENDTNMYTTYNYYPVGDLSGKYGPIYGSDQINVKNVKDNNLALTTGLISAVGRSVVIFKPQITEVPDSWKCTTIDLQPGDHSGHIITAQAFLSDGDFSAYVDLRQIVYDDGFTSVTTIHVSSGFSSVVPKFDENWHIHRGTLVNVADCGLAYGVYDPYNTFEYHKIKFNYNDNCNQDNPQACAVGDLSSKQSSSSGRDRKKLYVDEDVPLTSDKTVIGRSIMFHAENDGADRAVCANIKPTTPSYTIAFSSMVEYDYISFTEAVARTLDISRHRVVVVSNIDVPIVRGGCSRVMITIAGELNDRIDWLFDPLPYFMFQYKPTADCRYEKEIDKYVGMQSGSSKTVFNLFSVLITTSVAAILQQVLS